MKDAIRLVGVICVAVGILYMLRPDVTKRLMEFFKKGSRMYLAGVMRLALAVVFLIGADRCRHKWVIVGFGILFLISGCLMWFFKGILPPGVFEWSVIAHDVAFILAFLMLLVHVYLGIIHPRMTESLRSMWDGKISKSYARHHYGKWYDEVSQAEK